MQFGRHVFRGIYHPGNCRVRLLLWPVWADRAARSDNHPDCAKPDYFFLWLYALLSLLPPSLENAIPSHRPALSNYRIDSSAVSFRRRRKSWKRRPIAVITVLMIAITLGTFTRLAQFTPWSPHMNAWSGDPVPDRFIHGTTAVERQARWCFR